MWMPGLPAALVLLAALGVISRVVNSRKQQKEIDIRIAARKAEELRESVNASSILSKRAVQNALDNGAPATPWPIMPEDRQVMTAIETYFVRAIPNPNDDGRASIKETVGYGGAQLELYVPVLSTQSPVAVIAGDWDSESRSIESNLFFFGNVPERLAAVVTKSGFASIPKSDKDSSSVFRKARHVVRLRSA